MRKTARPRHATSNDPSSLKLPMLRGSSHVIQVELVEGMGFRLGALRRVAACLSWVALQVGDATRSACVGLKSWRSRRASRILACAMRVAVNAETNTAIICSCKCTLIWSLQSGLGYRPIPCIKIKTHQRGLRNIKSQANWDS